MAWQRKKELKEQKKEKKRGIGEKKIGEVLMDREADISLKSEVPL